MQHEVEAHQIPNWRPGSKIKVLKQPNKPVNDSVNVEIKMEKVN